MTKYNKEDLLFCPLGGSNEIGMNVNLYHFQGKWIIADLGAGFAGKNFPGVQMLAPDLDFIYQNIDDFLGIILTHAHEDHLGSVGWLWEQLQLPIYASPFTAAVARNKIQQSGFATRAELIEVDPNKAFDLGPFSIEMIHITHSIPEMNALAITTKHGKILHTGDWKLDDNPVVGEVTDYDRLKQIGDEGILAMVCDSTNIFTEKHSGSEADVYDSLVKLIGDAKQMVLVTTFASNIARLISVARAAKDSGRKVVLAGLTLHKMTTYAKESGYMHDIDDFISDQEMKNYSRNELVVLCTGSQGQDNAALAKIACGNHRNVKVIAKDTVIFSSKIIPGNEKDIFKLYNQFTRLGCDILTEQDHFVHVSGHPSRCELEEMYNMVKPQIAIPVHGEPLHLREHVRLIKKLKIPESVEIKNGEIIRLAPGKPTSIDNVKYGYLGVDQNNILHPEDGVVMRMRRKMMEEGIIFITVITDKGDNLIAEPVISMPGVVDEKEYHWLISELTSDLINVIESHSKNHNAEKLFSSIRKFIRKMVRNHTGKQPNIEIQLTKI